MRYHVFKFEGLNCVVDSETAALFSVSDEEADKIIKLQEGLEPNVNIDNHENDDVKDVKFIRGKKCHRLTLNLTSKCNLACRYCYANRGDYKQDVSGCSEMSLETVKNAVRKTIELYPEGIFMIQLFGGEPLLVKKNLKNIIDTIKSTAVEMGTEPPMIGMVTNGTLIDDETAKFLVEELSSITISLDGSEAVNDYNRCFPAKDGRGVYQKVKNAVKLLKKYKSDFHVKCEATVTAANIRDYIENGKKDNIYNSVFNDIGFDSCLCNPSFGSFDPDLSLENVDFEDIKQYFDDYNCHVIHDENGKLKSPLYLSKVIGVVLKKTDPTRHCGANKSDLAVDVTGDLYPCFMFIGEKDLKIGNVNDLFDEKIYSRYEKIHDFLGNVNDNAECNSCWMKKFCCVGSGLCIGARYLINGTTQKPIKLICDLSKSQMERYIWELIRYQKEK